MRKPLIQLERNNAGQLFIGGTDFDEHGYGMRAYVLCMQDDTTADRIMLSRFNDMVRLMGDNVDSEINITLD